MRVALGAPSLEIDMTSFGSPTSLPGPSAATRRTLLGSGVALAAGAALPSLANAASIWKWPQPLRVQLPGSRAIYRFDPLLVAPKLIRGLRRAFDQYTALALLPPPPRSTQAIDIFLSSPGVLMSIPMTFRASLEACVKGDLLDLGDPLIRAKLSGAGQLGGWTFAVLEAMALALYPRLRSREGWTHERSLLAAQGIVSYTAGGPASMIASNAVVGAIIAICRATDRAAARDPLIAGTTGPFADRVDLDFFLRNLRSTLRIVSSYRPGSDWSKPSDRTISFARIGYDGSNEPVATRWPTSWKAGTFALDLMQTVQAEETVDLIALSKNPDARPDLPWLPALMTLESVAPLIERYGLSRATQSFLR